MEEKKILDLDIEKLRKELCLNFQLPEQLKFKQIEFNNKFKQINKMFNKQIKIHKKWNKGEP